MSDQWALRLNTATHTSGLVLRFEGRPGSTHFGVNPLCIPQDLAPIEVARLIRQGLQHYQRHAVVPRRAAKGGGSAPAVTVRRRRTIRR